MVRIYSTHYVMPSISVEVVVIPQAAMKLHPNTNWKDYSQVNAIIETQSTFKN